MLKAKFKIGDLVKIRLNKTTEGANRSWQEARRSLGILVDCDERRRELVEDVQHADQRAGMRPRPYRVHFSNGVRFWLSEKEITKA